MYIQVWTSDLSPDLASLESLLSLESQILS